MTRAEQVNRVPMRTPGPGYLVLVAEENVEGFLDHGWELVQRRRSNQTDTGSTPTHRGQQDQYQGR